MNKNIKYTIIIGLIGLTHVLAQPTLPGQGNDGGNVTDTPINFLIYPLLLLGAYLGFRFFKTK